jgi:four helix bundle protein
VPEGKTKDKSKKIKVKLKIKEWSVGQIKRRTQIIAMDNNNDLCERLFEFAVRVIEFLKTLPYSPENKTIRTQLSKSACSSGANYEESQGGSSKADFSNKVRISLHEMRNQIIGLELLKELLKI